jgi:hypothetical protein
MANQKISDRTLASSLTGTEKIPIGVTGNKATTPDQLKTYVDAPATLDDLTDVVITTPSDGQVLTYDSVSGDWVNETPTGGGVASVTGDGVDNTDPDNPVLSYPTPGDIGALATGTAWLLASGGTLTGDNEIVGTGYTLKAVWALAASSTNGYGIWLANNTAATSGNQKIAPSIVLEGQGWRTTATAASRPVRFMTEMIPVQGTSDPSGLVRYRFSINNGAYTNFTTLDSNGIFTSRFLIASNSSSSFQTIFEVNKGSTFPVFRVTQEGRLTSISYGGGFIQNIGYHQYEGFVTLSRSATNQHSSYFKFLPEVICDQADTTMMISALQLVPTFTLTSYTGKSYGIFYSPTLTNNNAPHVAMYHDKGFIQWDSVLSPAQITSNQNDYNPTGFNSGGAPNGASILRLESDAARDITGLVGGVNGRLLIVANFGAFTITLKNEDAGSTAANRFLNTGSTDKILTTNTSTMLWYDGTSSRWRII